MSDYLPINNETALQFKKAGGEEDSEDGGKSIEGACVYSEQIIDDVFIQPMIPILFKRKLENDNDNLFTLFNF